MVRRALGHIPFATIDAWLRAHRSIWLSTTRPDGRPHAMPLWFWWDGRSVYFITAHDTQKARNLRDQPEVVVHGWDGDDVVILEGIATLVVKRAERDRVERGWAAKYVDPVSGDRDTTTRAHDQLYRVDVSRIMSWMYGTVAGRTDYVPGGKSWLPAGETKSGS